MNRDSEHYDIIGDIHGEADALLGLLKHLGYECRSGVWQNSHRKAIFLGDFIDRGPQQAAVLGVVMPMVQRGHALTVMGNHEFNALAFHTLRKDGEGWLRARTNKNLGQHWAFLREYLHRPAALEEALAFFRSLPLWLDLGGLRIVHACWSAEAMAWLAAHHEGPRLTERLLHEASEEKSEAYRHVETLLKGRELELPGQLKFEDKDGNERGEIRVRWWDRDAKSYRDAYLGPEQARTAIPEDETHGAHLIEYDPSAPPVFLGHYWMSGTPAPLAANIACVDYSVAKPGGKLVAYQWAGEQTLSADHFVWV